jgi:hypothetical protein
MSALPSRVNFENFGSQNYDIAVVLTKAIPEDLKSSLPTVEEIEAELSPSEPENPPT